MVYTAHYDTPTNKLFPSLVFPKNIPLFLLYTLGVTVVLLAIAFGAAALVSLLPVKRLVVIAMFLCVYVGLLLLMSYGPANQHNRNDNTAGLAALMTLMEQMPESGRSRVAFILFDNKEQGCGGSKDYAKQHVQAAYTQLTVNFDGIGVGETFFTIASPLAQKTDFYPRLKEGFRDGDGFQVQHLGSTGRMLREMTTPSSWASASWPASGRRASATIFPAFTPVTIRKPGRKTSPSWPSPWRHCGRRKPDGYHQHEGHRPCAQ